MEKFQRFNRLIIVVVFVLAIIFIVANKLFSSVVQNTTENATIERNKGLYIFIDSKPTKNYEVIGTVTLHLLVNGRPRECINTIIRKCNNNYKTADGILINTSDNMNEGTVIKFK